MPNSKKNICDIFQKEKDHKKENTILTYFLVVAIIAAVILTTISFYTLRERNRTIKGLNKELIAVEHIAPGKAEPGQINTAEPYVYNFINYYTALRQANMMLQIENEQLKKTVANLKRNNTRTQKELISAKEDAAVCEALRKVNNDKETDKNPLLAIGGEKGASSNTGDGEKHFF